MSCPTALYQYPILPYCNLILEKENQHWVEQYNWHVRICQSCQNYWTTRFCLTADYLSGMIDKFKTNPPVYFWSINLKGQRFGNNYDHHHLVLSSLAWRINVQTVERDKWLRV